MIPTESSTIAHGFDRNLFHVVLVDANQFTLAQIADLQDVFRENHVSAVIVPTLDTGAIRAVAIDPADLAELKRAILEAP